MSSLPPLAGEAAVVVTDDGRLQAEITAAGLGMEALDGDAFAMRLWTASPDGVDRVVRDLVAKRRRRPVTPAEMAAQLAAHFPSMSAAWLVRTEG